MDIFHMAKDIPALELHLAPVWPALFLLTLSASLWDTELTAQHLPRLRLPSSLPGVDLRLSKEPTLLQAVSKASYHQAWLLGGVAERLKAGAVSDTDAAALAACILSHPGEPKPLDPAKWACTTSYVGGPGAPQLLTRQAILDMGHLLQSRQAGLLSRLAGVLNLANILWVFGAIGVAVAFFPAVQPVLLVLLRTLGPLLTALHRALLPFYGLACYSAWLYVIAYATRCTRDSAPYMALTGAALALATYVVFGARYSHADPSPRAITVFVSSVHAFALLIFAPLAAAHRSVLLGFGAATALYSLLGFVVIPLCCGWCVGWNSGVEMRRTASAAAVLTVALLTLRTVRRAAASGVDVPSPLLLIELSARPFYPGLACFGSICLFLAGLIWSGRWYCFWGPGSDSKSALTAFLASAQGYAVRNFAVLSGMLAIMAAGSLLGDAMFVNVAVVFLALWASQKLCEVQAFSVAVLVLLGSAAMVAAGSFLKAHPHFVMSMLGSEPAVMAAAQAGL